MGVDGRIVRVGDTVRRPLYPWSDTVHLLLEYLESIGFPYSPRFLGIDGDGFEVLSYVDGESGADGWAPVVGDAGLVAMARLLRDYHDAVAGFTPPPGAEWSTHPGPVGEGEVVCHGDFGPWNLVWKGDRPIGIIDWDLAWPAPPMHDVAYALEYVAPFRDDAEAVRAMRHPAPPDRARRVERFATAYGLTDTSGLVDAVIAQQELVLSRAHRLADAGVQPQAGWRAAGDFDAVVERIAWSRANRALFPGL
ncbi:phosphotransferase [Virgisporangium aliadipatigenens]|uniref:Phosphotransferase n=1 Tax=Virgisporangium aliadipatigenens TaxID=741659 RepID=A0A8J3YSV7_9ACTN|nr:aminoglycoside phosphotransferase family protein [Virgisporangium aliadipatigenens]GIJ49148.1 phosphotransferase [Virgisporangium aliadipatigenens]